MIKAFQREVTDKEIAESFYKSNRYNTLFLLIAGVGFFVIYILAQLRMLGEPAPQLLGITFIVFLLAGAQFPLRALAKRGRGITVHIVATIIIVIFSVTLVNLWNGTTFIALTMLLIPSFQAISHGFSRKQYIPLLLITTVGLFFVYYTNANPLITDRLKTSSLVSITSFAFLATTVLLPITTFAISQSKRFKSIQTQLLASFSALIIIPILMATLLSAIGAFSNNQNQSLNTIKAVASLKETQLNSIINQTQNDASRLLADASFRANTLRVLGPTDLSPTLLENSKRIARSRMVDILGSEVENYVEFMVLNIKGELVISSEPQNEGVNFNSQAFYKQSLTKPFFAYANFPSFGNNNIVATHPIYDKDEQIIRGVLVLRASNQVVSGVMKTTEGLDDVETYLVDKNLVPLTTLKTPASIINTQATIEGSRAGFQSSSGVYKNYDGDSVLGLYSWYDPMQVIFITEIPTSVIITNSLSAITGSIAVAIIIVFIALAAVVISARSFVEPITSLAESSQKLASGEFNSRVKVERVDEIGVLGNTYNQMAEQLEDIIGKLEQRVANRTQELEDQTLRLRVVAEIARDAATARDVMDLLSRTAQLIQSRFSFYHTGIFMLDKEGEYAILTTSPTDAGKQMIANGHKLRVGEIGIVGRVASTGEPRITLDTGADAAYFNNPYLPDTRSEMALPLKVDQRVIGVLDIQSTEPQAFNDEDIAIMQALVDQLSTAIEKTRLLQQVEKSLYELQQAYGESTKDIWHSMADNNLLRESGYHFDNIKIQPIQTTTPEGYKAIKTGDIIRSDGDTETNSNLVAIPIKIRGQSIGVVTVKLRKGYKQNTVKTLEQAIERLAGSLESARLFEEAKLRADREQAIARVTTNISSATEISSILKTAVEEIGKTLGDTEVKVQILKSYEEQ